MRQNLLSASAYNPRIVVFKIQQNDLAAGVGIFHGASILVRCSVFDVFSTA